MAAITGSLTSALLHLPIPALSNADCLVPIGIIAACYAAGLPVEPTTALSCGALVALFYSTQSPLRNQLIISIAIGGSAIVWRFTGVSLIIPATAGLLLGRWLIAAANGSAKTWVVGLENGKKDSWLETKNVQNSLSKYLCVVTALFLASVLGVGIWLGDAAFMFLGTCYITTVAVCTVHFVHSQLCPGHLLFFDN